MATYYRQEIVANEAFQNLFTYFMGRPNSENDKRIRAPLLDLEKLFGQTFNWQATTLDQLLIRQALIEMDRPIAELQMDEKSYRAQDETFEIEKGLYLALTKSNYIGNTIERDLEEAIEQTDTNTVVFITGIRTDAIGCLDRLKTYVKKLNEKGICVISDYNQGDKDSQNGSIHSLFSLFGPLNSYTDIDDTVLSLRKIVETVFDFAPAYDCKGGFSLYT